MSDYRIDSLTVAYERDGPCICEFDIDPLPPEVVAVLNSRQVFSLIHSSGEGWQFEATPKQKPGGVVLENVEFLECST